MDPYPAGFIPHGRHRARAFAGAMLFACSAIVAGFPGVAHAYRPFDGTDADVADVGEFELELGPLHYLREDNSSFLIVPATVLNLGIVDRLELVADFKNFVALSEPEVGGHRVRLRDTDVLAKVLLRRGCLQGGFGPSVAIEAGVLLPEAGASTGFGSQANTIVSFAGDRAAVHFNESIAGNRGHRLELFSSAIVEGSKTSVVRPVAEVFVDRVVSGSSEYSALLGILWAHSQDFVFDLAGRAARADGAQVWEVRLGLTWSARVWRVRESN
jgi:hypothetical protein